MTKSADTNSFTWRVASTARDLLVQEPIPTLLAIDVPIGLPDSGARACDVEARKVLGKDRRGSVFPAPIRPILEARTYEAACAIGDRVEGRKVSRQCWAIVPKIREVDELLRTNPTFRQRVREVHPEVSFFFLADGVPLRNPKRKRAGREERRKLLEAVYGNRVQTAVNDCRKQGAKQDDVLDAFVALWSAERIFSGEYVALPSKDIRDRYGLRMEILG